LSISGSNLQSTHKMEVCLTYFQIRHDFEKLGMKWKYVRDTSTMHVSITHYASRSIDAKWRSVAPRTGQGTHFQ